MKMERKIFQAEVKEADPAKLICTHFISTERRDRVGDILLADGMKVEGKPVVLLTHGFGPLGSEPIAKCISLEKGEFKRNKGILAKTQFYDGSHLNPPDNTGKRLFEKTTSGIMPNWSVGWIPKKWEFKTERNGEETRIVSEWTLLEYSICGVPAQADAQTIDKDVNEICFKVMPSNGDDQVKDERLAFEEKTYGELYQYKDGQLVNMEEKPYPNEHACRLHPPTGYKRIRRQNDKFGKGIHAIWGVKDDDTTELQAIRFSKSKFTAKEARQWCKDHEYKCKPFEPATEKCEKCGQNMVVKWDGDVSGENIENTCDPDMDFTFHCPACSEDLEIETKKVVKVLLHGKREKVERWNKSLPECFDLEIGERPPAEWEYDLYRKFLKCEIKEIFMNEYQIPSPLLGTYLAGIKQIFEKSKLLDTRNFTSDGAESPPLHKMIKLNSIKSDDFLVSGIQFYKWDQVSLILKFTPNWCGIKVAVITSQEQKTFNKDLFERIHQWVKENNFLKGEKFALSGEFLEKTKDIWDDLILDDDLKKIIRNAIKQLNTKKQEMKSRGLLFVGRPGTGKTKMGRTIMNDSKSTFIWISSKDFQYGSSVGMISLAFSLAKDLNPAVIFLEDIDTWLGSYLVDLLKTEMDGLRQNMGIITILTSNNPENLPDALLDRPGRFHHVLDFKLPNLKQRFSMMRLWVGEEVDENILLEIVKKTDGFSGAHMRELVDFAKIISEEDGISIGMALKESLDRLMKQKNLINQIRTNQKSYLLPVIEFKAIRSDQAESVKFVMVDGDEIREKYNIDFTMGGNYYAWEFIPENEIWIEQDMDETDTIATKLHEFTERLIMKYLDWDYNDAHEVACKPERLLRHIMMAETDEAWGEDEDEDEEEDEDEDEENNEDYDEEEYNTFIRGFLTGNKKLLKRINDARQKKGLKPVEQKKKKTTDDVKAFVDFIKAMKEKFNSLEAKLDGLSAKLQEGLKPPVGEPVPKDKGEETKTDNPPEPRKVTVVTEDEKKAAIREALKGISDQITEAINKVVPGVVREEFDRLKGRIH